MNRRLPFVVLGLGLLSVSLRGPGASAAPPAAPCVASRGLVVLVEFPGTRQDVRRENVGDRFFTKLDNYVREMSYGHACITGEVTRRWYPMPRPISAYQISSRNLEVDRKRVEALVRDALEAADAHYDVSTYDFVALLLGATREEYGMIGLCAYPGMLGWETGSALKTKRGRAVKNGVAIFSYQAHLGTLFHDVAHVLGGMRSNGNRAVPCLYDHDLQARPGPLREAAVDAMVNMGFWDPMSCHFIERELPPPGISSWTKLRLGWLPETAVAVVKPGETRELLLGPLEESASANLAVRIPLSETTYYLLENRQPIGFDKVLPGSGLLVLRADDDVAECRHGKAPVKLVPADATVPHLQGAAFDFGKRTLFVDTENGVKIELLEKVGRAYRVRVGRTAPQGP